jgi:hypothetical protein
MEMNLSKNFTLEEATHSNYAISHGIDNSLPESLLKDAEWFAQQVVQPIRDKIGLPFNLTSWYRCPALNKAVGGQPNSAHLSGMAIDFTVEGHTAMESYNMVLTAIKDFRVISFDQLIIEHNTKTGAKWVHLAAKRVGNRNSAFAMEV